MEIAGAAYGLVPIEHCYRASGTNSNKEVLPLQNKDAYTHPTPAQLEPQAGLLRDFRVAVLFISGVALNGAERKLVVDQWQVAKIGPLCVYWRRVVRYIGHVTGGVRAQ